MGASAIIMMVLIFSIFWGGFLYMVYRTLTTKY
ncbi:MetS family NSS transporter small subunit [Bacillus rubiinfantis]|nr:MetS family NSS transporter small subunit [Bacillus rubiinfantis]